MGVSEESISKFVTGNRFHVKSRILVLKFLILREIDFLLNLMMELNPSSIVESTYLCEFESSQCDGS